MEGSEVVRFGTFRVYSRNDDNNMMRTIRKLKNLKMDENNDIALKKLMMNGAKSQVSQIDLIHGFECLLLGHEDAEKLCPSSYNFISSLTPTESLVVDTVQLMNFDEIHLHVKYNARVSEPNIKALVNQEKNRSIVSFKSENDVTYVVFKLDPVDLEDFFHILFQDTLQAIGKYGNKTGNVGMLQDVQILNLQSLSLMYAYILHKKTKMMSYSHHVLCIQPHSVVSVLGMLVLGSELTCAVKPLMSKHVSEIMMQVRDRWFFRAFGPIPLAFTRATFRAFRAGGSSNLLQLNDACSF